MKKLTKALRKAIADNREKYRLSLKIAGIVLLSFFLTYLLVYDISQLSYFAPANKTADFEPTDFYQLVEKSRPVKEYCPDVVVVTVDSLSRAEIASMIEEVGDMKPAVVAVDILWGYPQPGVDEYLTDVLTEMPCPVIVPDTSAYIYKNVANLQEGHVRFLSKGTTGSVRDVATGNSMARQMAAMLRVNGDASDADNRSIRFGHFDFEVVNPSQLSEASDLIEGRGVIFGTVDDLSDMHPTPVDASMPGVIIHAESVATLLDNSPVHQTPEWIGWIIAIVCCALFVGLTLFCKLHPGGDLMMRIFQVSFLIFIIFAGTMAYLHLNLNIDFSRALLMVGTAAIAVDVWIGVSELINKKRPAGSENT